MNSVIKSDISTRIIASVGIVAIMAGGVLSAFSAHAPSQPLVWTSAYLVLVVGLAQVALAMVLHGLAAKSSERLVLLFLLAFNISNICVIAGTIMPNANWLVNVGGVMLAASLLLCVYLLRSATKSWLLGLFYLVVATLLISIPIGLLLAQR